MLNQVVLVGRLSKEVVLEETESGKKVANITLAVPRNLKFKNENGEYDTDFINCILWNAIAESTSEHCKKGDLIGIEGRIEGQDGKVNIIAEKVTFLSSKKKEEK